MVISMDRQPLISLIIPVYNTEEYVGKCLDSIFAQTYKNIEIILVNNGSEGNINEIAEDYRRYYPDRVIKLVVHKKNQGTFHGRGSGMLVADGEYFTFMDADDRVGVDYFRALITTAETWGSEIVVADLVHEDENGKAFRYIVDPVRSMNIDICGKDKVFDFFYNFSGLSYSMYGIWNKLYKRVLWDRCLPFINAIKEQFALCEDAVYTTIFFSQANSVKNLHDQYYYHYVHSKSVSSGMAGSYEKAERSIRFQGAAFRNMRQHLVRAGLIDLYEHQFELFRGFHQRVMLFHIENSNLSKAEKKRLTAYCCDEFEDQHPGKLDDSELFFTQHFVAQTDDLENIRLQIANDQIKVVSFDVFDTALLRNVWQPSDLFEVMSPLYYELSGQNSSFPALRVLSEQRAREVYCASGSFSEEVTLDQIYQQLGKATALSAEALNTLKSREIELEKQLNCRRETTYSLYQLALYLKKIVIFTSDMYLPADIIALLLKENGYDQYHKLYVSSGAGVTKSSGHLYDQILREMRVQPQEIIHIGDNMQSDVAAAKKKKFQTAYFPKFQDVFCNFTTISDSGALYQEMFGSLDALQDRFALRQSLAVTMKKMFDNPFVSFHNESRFNGDPYYMGLYSGGPFVAAVCDRLHKIAAAAGIKHILFLGDDAELFEQHFTQIISANKSEIQSSYKNLPNTSLYIPPIRSRENMLSLATVIPIYLHTPRTLLEGLQPYLVQNIQEDYPKIFESLSIKADSQFTNILQAQRLLNSLAEYFDKRAVSNSKYDCVFTTGANLAAISYIWSMQPRQTFSVFQHPVLEENLLHPVEMLAPDRDRAYLSVFHALFRHPDKDHIGGYCIRRVFRTGVHDYLQNLMWSEQLVGKALSSSAGITAMDYLIEHCGVKDCYILTTTPLMDTPECSVADLWTGLVSKRIQQKLTGGLALIPYNGMDRFHKLVYLIFFDRKTLKQKIEKRYENRPLLRTIILGGYSVMRAIKNVFVKQ